MIIKALMEVVYALIFTLTIPMNIPPLPDGVISVMDTITQYLATGISIFSYFTHYQYILSLFLVVFAIDIGLAVYHLVMFVLRKIPFLGIK